MADSSLSIKQLQTIENHSNRPEILQAKSVGTAFTKRFSNSTNQEMLYFAIADHRGEEVYFIRVSVPYEYVADVIGTLDNSITLIVVVGLITSVIASLLAGDYTRESLVELERAVSRISDGAFKKKNLKDLPIKRTDEIGSMARNINSISMDLKNQITLIATQRDQFGSVLDDLGEGIMVMPQDGSISFCNEKFLEIFDLNEAVGKTLKELKIAPLTNLLKRATKKGKDDIEFELPGEGDSTRWILAHMNKTSATKEFIVVVHETTHLRHMDSMRRDFISNLSHELRTPVSVIKANSETLLDGAMENPTDAKSFTKAILHNADRLSEMVSSLIDLSRIEYGELKFIIEEIDIHSTITSVASFYANMLKKKGITLNMPLNSNFIVQADARALERVLNNLIDNAIKYSPVDSSIAIELSQVDEMVKISVIDNGEGITSDDQDKVFRRFYRTAQARANTQQGSGLGLAIVKNLVNNLQGEVGVNSRESKGSEFWFTIPVK